MRKLILKMATTLDGFVADLDGKADWMHRFHDEDGVAAVVETLWGAGVHAMGSRSFETMAGFWPTSTLPFAAPMNAIPKVVFTRQQSLQLPGGDGSAASASWANAQIANGDLTEEIKRLKAQDGNFILAHGGANFARSLVRLGLVDEFRLSVFPVALGSGMPLFSELEQPQYLKLVSSTLTRSGIVGQVYRPD
jgi:dihydrofolate reductase